MPIYCSRCREATASAQARFCANCGASLHRPLDQKPGRIDATQRFAYVLLGFAGLIFSLVLILGVVTSPPRPLVSEHPETTVSPSPIPTNVPVVSSAQKKTKGKRPSAQSLQARPSQEQTDLLARQDQHSLRTDQHKYSASDKSYITGPRGGCYYINGNGNKTYVDRSLCGEVVSYSNRDGYIRGPRGGCYYINGNGNKTYVSRSLCN